MNDGFGRAFEKVREADVKMAFAESDGGVERGESAKTDRDRGHGRARAEGPVFLLKDLDEFGGHHLQFTGWGGQVADDGEATFETLQIRLEIKTESGTVCNGVLADRATRMPAMLAHTIASSAARPQSNKLNARPN
jgi:hypothetical protein